MTVRLVLFAKVEFSCFHSPDVVINNTRILVWVWSTSLKDSYDRRRLKYIYLWVRFPSFQSFRKTKIKCRKSVLSKQAKMNVKKNSSLLRDNGRKKNNISTTQKNNTKQHILSEKATKEEEDRNDQLMIGQLDECQTNVKGVVRLIGQLGTDFLLKGNKISLHSLAIRSEFLLILLI